MEIKKVDQLARIMNKYGLTEVELKDSNDSILLKRATEENWAVNNAVYAGKTAAAALAVSVEEPDTPVKEEKRTYITAPMPGTFYIATSPENAPLVKVGDTINNDTVVCVVEAMKVMNEIKAEMSGTILKILVENSSSIEYGQRLFEIKQD